VTASGKQTFVPKVLELRPEVGRHNDHSGTVKANLEEGEGVYGDASCSGNPGVAVPSGVAGGAGAGAGPWPLDVYVAAASNTVQCQMQASKQVGCDNGCASEQNAPTVHACYKRKEQTTTFCTDLKPEGEVY